MAEIQDLEVEASEIEAVEEQDAKVEQAAQAKPDDEVPEEFKGMSAAEIGRIALHARREMGKQGNELGEIRKLADELIKSQLKKQPEAEKPKEIDFFENPQAAIDQRIENNPRVMAAEQYAVDSQRALKQQRLVQLHPDFKEVVQDAEFTDWIKASKVRSKLFAEAENYDVDAADELLSTFKQLKPKKEPVQVVTSPEEKAVRAKTMQAASVDTGGSGETTRKIYRRADLIRLNMRDPAKYADMADEIMLAYSEGRVK